MKCSICAFPKLPDGVVRVILPFAESTLIVTSAAFDSEKAIFPQKNVIYIADETKPIEQIVFKKIDINNCSEEDLQSLPVINIVMAKKAIKKREAIGGFKTIDDFIIYLRIKPHIEFQLRKQIYANKMNTTKKILRKTERSLDL